MRATEAISFYGQFFPRVEKKSIQNKVVETIVGPLDLTGEFAVDPEICLRWEKPGAPSCYQ